MKDPAPVAAMQANTHRTTCRICMNQCALQVRVEGGRVVEVKGDPEDPLFAGYTCVKGRAQPHYLYSPERILRPLKKVDGSFVEISMAQALDEIAQRLGAILAEHGPRALCTWAGTMQTATKSTAIPSLIALMEAIGSPFRYDPNTIDQGGKQVAAWFHGSWGAPAHGFGNPDAVMLIGVNPLVSCLGVPAGNPGLWLKQLVRGGKELIVIDPRRTETAERATLFIQPRPGFDAEILAAIVRTIIAEGLIDREFVSDNANGLDDLFAALAPFTPEAVGAVADVAPADLVRAARIYGAAGRAYTMAGTGANMAGPGSLIEYLVLALNTVRGHWMREGDEVTALPLLLPLREYRAQATPPAAGDWRMAESFVRGLSQTAAGHPAAAMIDHMLPGAEPRFRALISYGGNPAVGMPDGDKARRGLEALDLLVQIDPWMSATSALADYVLPPPMPLETTATTIQLDQVSGRATGFGMDRAYGHGSPPLVAPPPGADLLEEWKILAGIGERLGLELTARRFDGSTFALSSRLSSADLAEEMHRGSRVPYSQVVGNGRGAVYQDESVRVQPRETGWEGRFELAAGPMLDDLAQRAAGLGQTGDEAVLPFRLVSRRMRHVYNSSCHIDTTSRGRPYNPAFVNPADLAQLGLESGHRVAILSSRARIEAVVEPDPTLRRGLVSMTHCYGGKGDAYADGGENVNQLVPNDEVFDRFTGQPRMSNVPVRLEPA